MESSKASLRRRIVTSAAAAAAAALALTACAGGGSSSGSTGSGSDQPIIIGGSLGLTGTYSGPSAGYKLAYDYWVDQTNAAGGLLGRPVKLDIYDDGSNATTAQQLYQRLINEDHADLLLAPYATAVGASIVPITERAGRLVMDPGFFSKELHSSSKLLVSSWPYQDTEIAFPFLDYLGELPAGQKPSTLAVVAAQNPFTLVGLNGYDGKDGVLNKAKELGINVVFNQEYDQSATDLTGLIQQAQASGAQAFIALALPNDASLIAKTVNQVGWNPDYYCSCGSQVTTLPNWPDNGPGANNVFSTTTAWPSQGYPGLQELADYFAAHGSPNLPAYGAVAYAALQILGDAVTATGSLDDQTLHDYIIGHQFDTVLGPVSYNTDGTISFAALLVQFQGDSNQVIWPAKYATAQARTPLR